MAEPVATPKPPAAIFEAGALPATNSQILSSSPAFGTPAYPITKRAVKPVQPFAPLIKDTTTPSVLPILLPPQTLRPVAFRSLTKKHNLTLTSSGLGVLSTFIGKFCGSGWREEGLAERLLDEVAKQWKNNGGGILVEDGKDKKLTSILKSLEPCMNGGRIDTGKLTRSSSRSSSAAGTNLLRHTLDKRPETNRDDSQTSLGFSALDVEDNHSDIDDDAVSSNRDSRSYLKVISAFQQPRLMYSISKKHFEPINTPPSLLPPIQHKIAMFRNRYHLVHQRLMRNESFQTPSFAASAGPPNLMHSGSSVTTMQQAYKITPISNLLGRTGSSHLLLGLLVHAATGDLSLTDLSGSVVLDMSIARPVPEDGAWFCPGMIVLVEGTYEEDGSNNSNLGTAAGVGGQIKGRFIADTIAGPPAERRDLTLGTAGQKPESGHSASTGFGWIDFLGVGSEKAAGTQMRRMQKRLLGRSKDEEEARRRKAVMIGECHLDNPRTLEAIRAILTSYNNAGDIEELPLSIVLMGSFVSVASMAGSTKGGGSVEYKEYFDALASVLSEFPALLSSTTFVFVPGDNDPWASSFAAGAATVLPQQNIPELFTSRIRRAVATAITETGKKDGDCAGEAIWASNPARISLFGPLEELVLFRDDITGRLRRSAVTFASLHADDEEEEQAEATNAGAPELMDVEVQEATSHLPKSAPQAGANKTDTATARKLVKTILDQGHLAPFPLSIRPVFWDYASALTLYPLPTALVLADAEAPAFAVTYEGCHVMNPGRVLDELGARKGVAKWMEYDMSSRKGVVRDVRF